MLENVVEKAHPGILSHPELIWNTDETAVDETEGKPVKVFSSVQIRYVVYRKCLTKNRPSQHIKTVILCSAAGFIAPSFLIVAGKNDMSIWFEPVIGTFQMPLPVLFKK